MGGKFSPVIIIVLILVAVAIGLLGFSMLSTPDPSVNKNQVGPAETEAIEPILEFEREITDDKLMVTIIAKAKTDDEQGIESITLPDESVINGDEARFEVTANDTYKFVVKGKNGKEKEFAFSVSEIVKASSTNPYVPEGFTKLGRDEDPDFIIGDEYGNQFVWIPVESGVFARGDRDFDINYDENNASAQGLVNSISKYYGFYIGRFEASEYILDDGTTVAATMNGKTPWTNITCEEAMTYSKEAGDKFGYGNDVSTALINSYAWDTAVAYIEEEYPGYSSSNAYGNFEGTILPTGATEKDRLRGICDLSGNVREWTTERYNEITQDRNGRNQENEVYRIARGGSAILSRTPSSRTKYPEKLSDPYWGFRVILFKI